MKIFVQTRGKTADYAFLADAPSNRWWLDFRTGSSFEQPTLIVCSDKNDWRCFLSGISSSRVDRVGTTARYSIAMEGTCGFKVETVLSIVAAWLEDVTSSTPKGQVRAAMDQAFDDATVERLLGIRTANSESADEVERLAIHALSNLAVPTPRPGRVASESWVGSKASPEAKDEFLARCSQLILGNVEGAAAVLNLLGTVDEVEGFASNFRSLAALIDDESDDLRHIVPIEKKKPGNSPQVMPPISKPAVPWMPIAIAIGAILLIVILVVLPNASAPPQGNVSPPAGYQPGK